MNLLCPNCQKMLTVPEQYAGQLMKCPLCNGTFTVPALPAAPTAPPPPPTPAPEIFNFKDPAPPAPPTSAPPSFTAPVTQPAAPPPPPPPPLPPGEYTRKATIWFSPKVLQFVPAAAAVLLFFPQFAPWVGVYFGGYAVVTQNAWGAMYGSQPPEENDLKGLFRWTTPVELDKNLKDGKDMPGTILAYPPSWSPLELLYLLLYYPTAALTIACVVLPYVPLKLPPPVQSLLRWKWAFALLLNLLLLFFLVLQLVMGFGVETGIKNAQLSRQNYLVKAREKADEPPLPKMQLDATISDAVSHVQLTYWVCLVVMLHFLAIVGALLMFWLNQRETFNKPLPELTLRW